ncbi:hypothetical protein BY996DRAFT_6413649 [Phakopsora pachyrhizi]|nr:hypothetical protein BY996DRAFT_6413649 [Phakopsora pachyrhizi]
MSNKTASQITYLHISERFRTCLHPCASLSFKVQTTELNECIIAHHCLPDKNAKSAIYYRYLTFNPPSVSSASSQFSLVDLVANSFFTNLLNVEGNSNLRAAYGCVQKTGKYDPHPKRLGVCKEW